MNNVRPEWCLDRPKVPLAGNVDSEVTQTPILEQTAKHSPVNLRALSKVRTGRPDHGWTRLSGNEIGFFHEL